MINMTELGSEFGPDFCTVLLGIYVFTGEDTASAFNGKGKIVPVKKLQTLQTYQACFRSLGESSTVTDSQIKKLGGFFCALHGYPRIKSVDEVRFVMLEKMVKG